MSETIRPPWDASEPSPRGLDPPQRKHFVNNLPPHERATALILDYVATRVERGDKAESAACRNFLKAYRCATLAGNAMNVGLSAVDAGKGSVQFFHNIHGIGPVVWLPRLVTAANDHTAHILRECGPYRLAFSTSARENQSDADEGRKRIPPRTETVLVLGDRKPG